MTASSIFPLSYSRMATYEQCPKKFYYLYVSKLVVDIPHESAVWGTYVHQQFENRLKDRTPFPKTLSQYEPIASSLETTSGVIHSELEMASTTDMQPVSFTSESAFVRGVADVVIDRGTTAFIFDFKTGKKRPKPEQLNLYAALYAVANPQTEKFVASFLWLQEKDITTYSFNKTEALRGIEWAKEVSRKIQLDMERERWQEKPSAMCRWCPAKSICPSGKRY